MGIIKLIKIIDGPNSPPPSSLKGNGKSFVCKQSVDKLFPNNKWTRHYYCLQCNHAGHYGYKQNDLFSLYYIVILMLGFYEINVLNFYFNGCEII